MRLREPLKSRPSEEKGIRLSTRLTKGDSAVFELGQRVVVITDHGTPYDATILATAKGDNGPGAYKVAPYGRGPEQLGQWHKASDVFAPDQTDEEKKDSWNSWLKE
jgi:hypothetical protein